MTQYDFHSGPDQVGAPEGLSVLQLVSVALSAILTVLFLAWVIQVVVRDVRGVPVVQKTIEARRVAFDGQQSAGATVPNQGLTVNAVLSEGTASDAEVSLDLGPRDVSLTPEDLGVVTEGEAESLAIDDGTQAALGPLDTTEGLVPVIPPNTPLSLGNATLADGLAGEQVIPVPEVLSSPEQEAKILPANHPGARSLVPVKRPIDLAKRARLAATATPTAPVTAATGQAKELSPNSIPSGTSLVQLGALSSAAAARTEWDRFARKFPEYFEDKTRVIEAAEHGGRTHYRLRVHGFADRSDSRRFCAVIAAKGENCLPWTVQ